MQRLRIAASLGAGIVSDIKNRRSTYKDDWKDISSAKLRILAAGVYIFLASALPALAFGVQFQKETDNIIHVVHVLISTAIGGLTQCLIGGQPLLIVGVAEPIVLVYSYMYSFAEDQQDLGSERFLAWAAWTCVWAGIIVVLLALTNACAYISKFTRYAGESFGALIALLFIQQAIKGLVNEFSYPESEIEGENQAPWQTINGLWAILLALGLLFSGLTIRKARKWKYLSSPVRAILADYGVPLLVIAWTGLSYAISSPNSSNIGGSVPSRVSAPNTWAMGSASWTVSTQMLEVPGKYIAAALIPGLIMAVLFYFDHNVSGQLAQQEEFNLKRATAHHWDLFILGIITIVLGILGLPPINGVIPQSPMHTKALSTVVTKKDNDKNGGVGGQSSNGDVVKKKKIIGEIAKELDGNGATVHSTTINGTFESPFQAFPSPPTNANDSVIQLSVVEQRGSGLLQSLLVGACLAIMPAIRCIPTAVLWGYFAFMAAESLPGSQLWDRTLLLLTDPKRRYLVLEKGHTPYLEIVKYKTVVAFTLIQLVVVGAVYGLTWAGIAGVLFPLPILALVPFRQYILPRWFSNVDLNALDKLEEEEAAPLEHEAAVEVAASAGLAAISPTGSVHGGNIVEGGGLSEMEEMVDNEVHHYRVVHHLSEAELVNRRRSAALARQSLQNGSGEDGNNV
ncbi:hypothetical protein Ndes2437B_g07632 [Nannochloris sp. 'desiccata']|nr:hypothetical protein KSW81_005547 [Chlorella desiccata (nom. nud.)]